jgi:hypothetical protein
MQTTIKGWIERCVTGSLEKQRRRRNFHQKVVTKFEGKLSQQYLMMKVIYGGY